MVNGELHAAAKREHEALEQKRSAQSLTRRSHYLQAELRDMYTHIRDEYLAGARLIMSGETVFWSDLLSLGGERSQPFDPEPLLALQLSAGR